MRFVLLFVLALVAVLFDHAIGRLVVTGYPTGHGRWHQIAVAVYPSPAAMMTMLALPKYRTAHVHRAAALTRTRLLATQPIADLPIPR
jgi:hypothetical protein